jgi:hypothetical protein
MELTRKHMAVSFKTLVDPSDAAAYAVIQFADMGVIISATLDTDLPMPPLHTIYFVLITNSLRKENRRPDLQMLTSKAYFHVSLSGLYLLSGLKCNVKNNNTYCHV